MANKNKLKALLILLPFMALTVSCGSDGGSSSNSDNSSTSQPTEVLLDRIVLTGSYQTSFYVNEQFNHEGLVVTAHYSDGASKEVQDYTVSTPDTATKGEKDVKVNYTEKSVTKEASYVITVKEKANEELRLQALEELRRAFNELDIEDYSSKRWASIIEKFQNGIKGIEKATFNEDISSIKEETLNFFASSPKASEITKGTLFDYHSSDSNYEFDRDNDNHLVISYDGYPGHWVSCGTRKNLITDVSQNNIFSLTFRNDIAEQIEVCLQATNDSGSYKKDTGIVKVKGNETKTLTFDYDIEISKLYFFIDSCSVHNRKGQITILETKLSYEDRTPTVIYAPKTFAVNQDLKSEDEGASTVYALKEEDKGTFIERVDALVEVLYNGNDNGHRYFGLHLKAAGNQVSVKDDGHSQSIKEGGTEVGARILFNLPIASSSKLSTGSNISMDISYAADNLTFKVISYTVYYTLWKETEAETINVNQSLQINGAYKDESGNPYTATIPYSSFTKKERVVKMDVTFTTVNTASYAKSQIYLQNFEFTRFESGNNNVLNIGSIMNKNSNEPKTGTISLYPTSEVNLKEDKNILIECWWASSKDIKVDSVTIHTDKA